MPPPPKRSRAVRHPLVVFLNFVLTIVIIAVVVLGGGLLIGKMQFERPGSLDQARTITVDKGAGVRDIADRLQRDGVVSSKWLFIAGVWLNREGNNLKAGEYPIPAHASMRDIMDLMVEGKSIVYSDHHPRGPDQRAGGRLPDGGQRPEGQDIPGLTATRKRSAGIGGALVGPRRRCRPKARCCPRPTSSAAATPARTSSTRMMRERDRVLTDVWARRAPDLPLNSIDELVMLASIVEKETVARRRAEAGRRGLHQPAAPQHAAAVRPDDHLRPVRRRRASRTAT